MSDTSIERATRTHGRRALLGTAAAAMAAIAVKGALEPRAAQAAAMSTDQDNPASTAATGVTQSGDFTAFYGKNTAVSGSNRKGLVGVVGGASPAPLDGVGVHGISSVGTRIGVYGESQDASGFGVFAANTGGGRALEVAGRATAEASEGTGGAVEVTNSATSGTSRRSVLARIGSGSPSLKDGVALHGYSSIADSNTIYGESVGDFGTGVFGEATGTEGIGVLGEANDAAGIGVWAKSTGGNALVVDGKSTFSAAATFATSVSAATLAGAGSGITALNASNLASGTVGDARLSANVPKLDGSSNTFKGQVNAGKLAGPAGKALVLVGSGSGTIGKGKASATFTNSLCKSTSKVLVTLQTTTGGVQLIGVKPAAGKFTVALVGNAKASVKFAYLILG